MTDGVCRFASANSSRTRFGPLPPKISMKSAPLHEKNGTPASPATAFASSVFPVPGRPVRSAPFGRRAPRAVNFRGFLRKSTYWRTSSFASGTPMTFSNLVSFTSMRKLRRCTGFIRSIICDICGPARPPPLFIR